MKSAVAYIQNFRQILTELYENWFPRDECSLRKCTALLCHRQVSIHFFCVLLFLPSHQRINHLRRGEIRGLVRGTFPADVLKSQLSFPESWEQILVYICIHDMNTAHECTIYSCENVHFAAESWDDVFKCQRHWERRVERGTHDRDKTCRSKTPLVCLMEYHKLCCTSSAAWRSRPIATHCNTLQHTATHCNTLQQVVLHGGQDDLCSTTCNTPTILTPLVFGESLTANLSMCTCTCTCLLLKSNISYFFLCGDFHMYLSLSLSLSLSISHATIMKLVVIEWFHNFIQMTWSWAKMAQESWYVQEALALYGAQNLNTLQHTATHCNTLQHTATHCNTLQHTATLYRAQDYLYNTDIQCCSVLQCVAVCCSVNADIHSPLYDMYIQW